LLSLTVVAIIWGTTFVITKSALDEIPPLLLALLRFSVASAILLPLVSLRGGLALLPSPVPIGVLAAMGLTGVALYFIGFNLSLVYMSASAASLLQATTPAITAVMAVAFLGERFMARRAAGIGLSMLGVALIVLAAEAGADAPNPLLGALFMLGAQSAWAVYTTISKRVQHLSRLAVTAYSSALGTLLLVPAGAFDLLTRPPQAVAPPPRP
jgi:drug/metabolite transporter (DMT)-like permease